MLPDEKIMCHRTGFAVSCYDGVTKHKCRLWCHVSGTDAMGQTIDVFGCGDELDIKLLHEVAKEIRQAAASTDKVATEVLKLSEATAARDVHFINGIRASFPVLHLMRDQAPPQVTDGRDDEPTGSD